MTKQLLTVSEIANIAHMNAATIRARIRRLKLTPHGSLRPALYDAYDANEVIGVALGGTWTPKKTGRSASARSQDETNHQTIQGMAQ